MLEELIIYAIIAAIIVAFIKAIPWIRGIIRGEPNEEELKKPDEEPKETRSAAELIGARYAAEEQKNKSSIDRSQKL